MRTFLRSLFVGSIALSTVAGIVPVPFAEAEDAPDEVADPLSPTTFPAPFFMAKIRWGNVMGEPESKDPVDMNGSVTLSSGTLELVRTLLFEDHDALGTVTPTSIPWTSKIYGHWDGLLIRGTAPKDATVTVTVGSTTVTKPVSEFVRLKKEVLDLGSGRELVMQVHPVREPAVVVQAFWGRVGHREAVFTPTQEQSHPLMTLLSETDATGTDDSEEKELDDEEDIVPPPSLDVNFSGDFTISGATFKFAKPIAFEADQGDVLNPPSGDKVTWTSKIRGENLLAERPLCAVLEHNGIAVPPTLPCPLKRFDRDGFVVGARLSTLRDTTSFTIRFTDPAVNYTKTFSFKDLWHRKFLFEPIPVNGQFSGLGLVVQVHALRSGNLVRAKGRPEVFRIEDGMKRHVVSPDAFRLRGFDWRDVQEVEPEEIESVPEGDTLDLPEGTPVKGRGPAVFVMSDGGLCPVASPQAFEAVGLKWEDIIPVPDETINAKPRCKTIDDGNDLPDGSLVRPQGRPNVFRVDNGNLIAIPSPDVFEANGFRWDRVREIAPGLAASLPQEGSLDMPEGAVVRGNAPTVFVVEQGKKRPFPSADDFLNSGFRWDGVHKVIDQTLQRIPSGSSVLR